MTNATPLSISGQCSRLVSQCIVIIVPVTTFFTFFGVWEIGCSFSVGPAPSAPLGREGVGYWDGPALSYVMPTYGSKGIVDLR